MTPMPDTLPDWLAWIERQHPRSIDMGLERVREVAARMGLARPARHVITVGGTNGKGSTVAFIEAIARAAGWKVGAYTSPHLLAYNERVRIDGHDADRSEEHTSELQSLMRISYAVFCLKKKKNKKMNEEITQHNAKTTHNTTSTTGLKSTH